MGGGIAFPSICQARRVFVGSGKPHGKPCATANSVGVRNLRPNLVSRKNPCHPLWDGPKVSAAVPYDLITVGRGCPAATIRG